MIMAACSKKLLKSVEADLQKEVELQKARRILQCFSNSSGRGVPTILVKAAVKTIYKHTRKRSVKKEQKITESITKYADVIEENMSALSGLLSDVMYDTSNLLDAIALDESPSQKEEEEEEGEEKEEEELDYLLRSLIQHQDRQQQQQQQQQQQKKTSQTPKRKQIAATPSATLTKKISWDTDNNDSSSIQQQQQQQQP